MKLNQEEITAVATIAHKEIYQHHQEAFETLFIEKKQSFENEPETKAIMELIEQFPSVSPYMKSVLLSLRASKKVPLPEAIPDRTSPYFPIAFVEVKNYVLFFQSQYKSSQGLKDTVVEHFKKQEIVWRT